MVLPQVCQQEEGQEAQKEKAPGTLTRPAAGTSGTASEGSWGRSGILPAPHIPAGSGPRKPEDENTPSTLDRAPRQTGLGGPGRVTAVGLQESRGSGPPRPRFSMTSDKYY